MNREEAIERLKTDIYKYADFTENPNENEFWMAFDMAIKALERTEPQGVFYKGDGYYDGELVYDFAECPKCGYGYEDGDKDWGLPFCPNCGQALNWESEVEE